MTYTHIVFDLDGTLTDPRLGITEAIKYALVRLEQPIPSEEELLEFIGPPLFDSFVERIGLSPAKAMKAVDLYREYYSRQGLYENHPYPGIQELLTALKAADRKLYVATSKPEVYARKILVHFGMDGYFDCIAGSTLDGSISKKEEVLDHLIRKCGLIQRERVLMVGDRKFDIEGARHAGFHAAAVLYGYGSREELESHGPEFLVEAPEGVGRIVLGDSSPAATEDQPVEL